MGFFKKKGKDDTRKDEIYDFKVLAFGFIQKKFTIDSDCFTQNNIKYEIKSIFDNVVFTDYDGIIIPSGVFEFYEYGELKYYQEILDEKKKELRNFISENKWICFLADEIKDRIREDLFNSYDVSYTDLSKVVLNWFGIHREIQEQTFIKSNFDEFKKYNEKYGFGITRYSSSIINQDGIDVLIQDEHNIYGFSIYQKIYYLPFHCATKDFNTLKEILIITTKSIKDFRKNKLQESIDWLNKFEFDNEIVLKENVEKLHEIINRKKEQINKYFKYKKLLLYKNDKLKNEVISVLVDFFNLEVDPIDERKEDCKILDKNGNILAYVEIKGTNKGIKRDHVTQVSDHRIRNGCGDNVPGLLIINPNMTIHSIKEKYLKEPPLNNISLANKKNILIIRIIDLLLLMKIWENNDDKSEEFLRLLNEGGGWITKKDNEVKIYK